MGTCRPGVSDGLDENMSPVAIPGAMASMKDDGVTDDLYFCTMQTIIRTADFMAESNFRCPSFLSAIPQMSLPQKLKRAYSLPLLSEMGRDLTDCVGEESHHKRLPGRDLSEECAQLCRVMRCA